MLKDILYFESQGNNMKVCLSDKIVTAQKLTISELAEKLPAADFVRIHRSYIVNMNYVTAVNKNEVLIGKIYVPAGRTYKKDFESFTRLFLNKRTLIL